MKSSLALLAAAIAMAPPCIAAPHGPFLRPHDVVALIGGEDMVAATEHGHLELWLHRALPSHNLKFRTLAWEGDTVFDQPRELNYPNLEAQLDEIGATVVIMQFGKMESLAGSSRLPEFIQAYEKLIERVSAGGKRRVMLLEPGGFAPAQAGHRGDDFQAYVAALRDIERSKRVPLLKTVDADSSGLLRGDGVHLNHAGHTVAGARIAKQIAASPASASIKADDKLLELITTKNGLWFHYYRPQNWAFLNGDRTEQPSSRDHKDPSKRWFPDEMKQFLALVAAKEKEIWDLAGKGIQK